MRCKICLVLLIIALLGVASMFFGSLIIVLFGCGAVAHAFSYVGV